MENKERSWDHLKKLTKDQIIQFLKEKFFLTAPKNNDIIFFMWNIEASKLEKLREDHLSNSPDMKPRDELAKRFNASTDADERHVLLKKIVACDKKWENHNKEWDAIQVRQKKNDKLYKSIER